MKRKNRDQKIRFIERYIDAETTMRRRDQKLIIEILNINGRELTDKDVTNVFNRVYKKASSTNEWQYIYKAG